MGKAASWAWASCLLEHSCPLMCLGEQHSMAQMLGTFNPKEDQKPPSSKSRRYFLTQRCPHCRPRGSLRAPSWPQPHLRHSSSGLMRFLLITPVSSSQRVFQAIRYNPCFNCQLQVKILPSINKLLCIDADFFKQILKHPVKYNGTALNTSKSTTHILFGENAAHRQGKWWRQSCTKHTSTHSSHTQQEEQWGEKSKTIFSRLKTKNVEKH